MPRTVCELCGELEEYDDMQYHKTTLDHRFNFLLWEYNNFRKQKEKNKEIKIVPYLQNRIKNGINFMYNESKKYASVQLSLETNREINRQIKIRLQISNTGRNTVYVHVVILHPHKYFSLENNNNIYELRSNEQCAPVLLFNLNCDIVSSFDIPLAFTIQPKNNPDDYYSLYRNIKIFICAKKYEEEDEHFNSPFREEIWENISQIIKPLTNAKLCSEFQIPTEMNRIMYHGLHKFSTMTREESVLCNAIKYLLQDGASRHKYIEYFQALLWLDESYAGLQLMKYNMSNVCMKVKRYDELELVVPGLAEKRPSVIVGDIINIRLHKDNKVYQGIVIVVTDKTIIIKYVDPELIYIIKENEAIELDVSFNLTRLLYDRMHTAVTSMTNFMDVLFPEAPKNIIIPIDLRTTDLLNQNIGKNDEQFMAVKNIISCTSQQAPYIIFGPPGTGKTVTIVESIYQLMKLFPKKKILICAPSNAACDMLARKLSSFCNKNQLLRIYTSTRNIAEIPEDLKSFSNFIDDDICVINSSEIAKYNIVVATLHLIGKYNIKQYGGYSPDILFIDEAAQATEPECCIPMALMLSVRQIILAGDPMQLGPVISSKLADSLGLGKSLMERLMETNNLYKPIKTSPLQYNSNFLTMLVRNYRSHKNIIHVPNDLFYNNTLTYVYHDDPISKVFISREVCNGKSNICKQLGDSVEFCGVLSKEQRTGCSPSFFNKAEIDMVIKYINFMTSMSAIKVKPIDIGVISPYIRQVQRIKQILNDNNLEDIQVGTTESFQGQEKRIIIISTVRAQHSLLKYDKQYNLGFVKNSRRFNVAVTRAISKVIVIGNPYCLAYDKKNWLKYIEYCNDLNSYFGVEFMPRTKEVKQDIIKRLGPTGKKERKKK